MADVRIPAKLAGDPFSSRIGEEEGVHVCNHGWVSIGQMVLDPETGEETEEQALYLCQICAREARERK